MPRYVTFKGFQVLFSVRLCKVLGVTKNPNHSETSTQYSLTSFSGQLQI